MCSLTNFVSFILVSFCTMMNFRNILACGWRAGIVGDRCSRAKARWHRLPCGVGQMSSSSPAWWHQHEDKLQHFNPSAPVGATQNKRILFSRQYSAGSDGCHRDGEQDGLACECLGTCKGMHEDVSCKHSQCWGLLRGACCGAGTHRAVCVTAGAEGCGIRRG